MMSSDRETELAARLSLTEVVNELNKATSGFPCKLDEKQFTAPSEVIALSMSPHRCCLVYCVTFHTPTGPKSVIVKIPTASVFVPEDTTEKCVWMALENSASIFNNELAVFRMFRKIGTRDLKVPRFFGGRKWFPRESDVGFVLVEDTSNRVYHEPDDDVHNFSDFQVREAIKEIAKMQALGFLVPRDEADELGREDLVLQHMFATFFDALAQLRLLSVLFLSPARFEQLCKLNSTESFIEISKAHEYEHLPDVLVHDNLQMGNILFDEHDHVFALLDWQAARFGNFALDLASILVLALSGAERRRHQDEYLRFYIFQLKSHLDKYRISNADGFRNLSLEAVRKVFREAMKWALVTAVEAFLLHEAAHVSEKSEEGPWAERLRCCIEDVFP